MKCLEMSYMCIVNMNKITEVKENDVRGWCKGNRMKGREGSKCKVRLGHVRQKRHQVYSSI